MIEIKKADIIAVTGNKSQYPIEDRFELAFAGRSNVGKSSLLNLLTNRKKLAKVSSSPGKTRTINFYDINDEFRIVDLPGYGYAKVSKSMSNSWGDMIEEYLSTRNKLLKVIQLIDIRHEPTKQDIQMYEYLKYYGLDGVVVATKADKISNNHIFKHKQMIKKVLNMKEDDVIISISSLKKKGQDELLKVMSDILENAKG